MTHKHEHGAAPIEQEWHTYTNEQHDRWRRLYKRMIEILPGRACPEFLQGVKELNVSEGIPDYYRKINPVLKAKTGWEVVCVAGLVPDDDFFAYLSRRQFPSTRFLREESQFDYIVEPDIFHDGFGHLPMLMNPVIADYMQQYGMGGLKVWGNAKRLKQLARLYWYTIEFGLVQTSEGMRIYGSGIASSPEESVYSLESSLPKRIAFQLMRVMRTKYEIDHLQAGYFVIPSIEELMNVTLQDFANIYLGLEFMEEVEPGVVLPGLDEKIIPPNPPRLR